VVHRYVFLVFEQEGAFPSGGGKAGKVQRSRFQLAEYVHGSGDITPAVAGNFFETQKLA
jgi:hypothetical protein